MSRFLRKKKIGLFITHFIICELVFLPLFAFIYVYHGPFSNLRDYVVSTSMGTEYYRFWSTWFLSTDEINQILARTSPVVKDATQNINNIVIPVNNSAEHDNSKTDTNVKVEDIKGPDYVGKMLVVGDPSRVTIGIAPNLGQAGTTLSKIIQHYNAIGGINAGGFSDAIGAVPDGIVIEDGKIKFSKNNVTSYGVIGFNKNNVLVISNRMSLDEIKKANLRCALTFGPALILNGQPLVTQGGTTLHPRSAIAQRKDGTILMVAIDGRQKASKGVNLKTLEDILLKKGAYNAANLDGGGSTTLALNGSILNTPSDITGERAIPTAFIITP